MKGFSIAQYFVFINCNKCDLLSLYPTVLCHLIPAFAIKPQLPGGIRIEIYFGLFGCGPQMNCLYYRPGLNSLLASLIKCYVLKHRYVTSLRRSGRHPRKLLSIFLIPLLAKHFLHFFIMKEKKRRVRAFQHANIPIFHGLTEERKNKLVFTRAEINEKYVDQIFK